MTLGQAMIQPDRVELIVAAAAGAVLGGVTGYLISNLAGSGGWPKILIWALIGAVVVSGMVYCLRALRYWMPPAAFRAALVRRGIGRPTMNDRNEDANQTDEDDLLRDEVSDEAVEAASNARGGFATLLYGTYCFACPLGQRSAAKLLSKDEARRIAASVAKLPELPSKWRPSLDSWAGRS
jgi:hypothetical protein